MEQKSSEFIEQFKKDICEHYCKYRDKSDGECLRDITMEGRECPLDRLC